ncbi:hypothetical protein P4607_14010 [Priestia megaterium]|nr:hypothetical protein [Priestia megaterium]
MRGERMSIYTVRKVGGRGGLLATYPNADRLRVAVKNNSGDCRKGSYILE